MFSSLSKSCLRFFSFPDSSSRRKNCFTTHSNQQRKYERNSFMGKGCFNLSKLYMVFIDFFNARVKVLFKCCPSLQRTLKVSKYSGLHRPLKIMQVLVVVLVFFIRFGSKMGRPILFIGFGTRGARGACAPHFPNNFQSSGNNF